jgi:AcrR family transcriptional regulator
MTTVSPSRVKSPEPDAERDRDEVPAAFRPRLLAALEQSISERGYRETTITDVVRIARASRRTFYKVFSTKDEALIALAQQLDETLVSEMRAAVDEHINWREQVDCAVRTYFAHVRQHPAAYRCIIRELPYLGEFVADFIESSQNAFVEIIRELTDNEEFREHGLDPASRPIALMILGGLDGLLADLLQSGRDVFEVADLAVAATTALLTSHVQAENARSLPK